MLDKWMGSESIATALMSDVCYSTERRRRSRKKMSAFLLLLPGMCFTA